MLEKYYRISRTAGVSINVRQDGSILIQACEITATGDQLSIDKKLLDLYTVEDLKKNLSAGIPVALALSGKGVLQKQIEKVEEINADNFNKILPGANIDEFYSQHFVSGVQSFISAVRKPDADRWINQLKEYGFIPLLLCLGPFPVQNIISQLNMYDGELLFNGHIIHRNNESHWTSYQYDPSAVSPFPLKVESEPINEKLVIPYAAAFQLVLAANLDVIQAAVPSLANEFHRKIIDNQLKVKGTIFVTGLFVLLLINFFLFSWLNSANAKLTEQISRSSQSTTDVQQINDQVQQKETLLKELGWEDDLDKSRLVDQIATLLPSEITWKEAAVDPVDLSESRVQKAVVFFTRKIRITGTSEKIIPVNEWIARIKTKAWVKKVELDNYTFNNDLNTGQFTIVIDY
jgi:Tfp pilus assembly protein PilN